ncbi:MAG: sialate O-acetylesterase [Lentisphaerae bacterium]|nr:sialate O-acetylesterase [Lentisphaerota bacterium]
MITITTGLWPGQVLQRGARDVSDAVVTGTCTARGGVWARVRREGRPRRHEGWRRIGTAARERFHARLRGIPTGGPYAVDLCVGTPRDGGVDLTVGDVWVGDVWMLGGQSNMQGSGVREAALPGMTPVRAFYMHDHWDVARDPIHNTWNAVDPVHGGRPDGKDGGKGVGPGVSFGQAMYAYTGIPQGLIPCAHSGTSLTQWDPAHRSLGGYSYYGATLRRFRKNGGRVAGVVWYQGESDSMTREADQYQDRMLDFIGSLRRDFKQPRLPFVLVQLARYAGENQTPECWHQVQEIQRLLPTRLPRVATVPAIDLALEDVVHISGRSQQVLGVRLAEAMYALVHPGGSLQLPIALKKVSAEVRSGDQLATITAEFTHVVGKLNAAGRPMGFDVHSGGAHYPAIFDVRLDGPCVRLRTTRTVLDFVDKQLHYGYGLDPACNVFDSAGRPLPVFGPVPIMRPRLATPYPKSLRVSAMLPGAGTLATLAYPRDARALAFTPRATDYNFLNVNPEFSRQEADALIFMSCRLRCPEAMRLALLFGYDGPVKLWIDGQRRWHDPKGTNPAVPDQHAVPFHASRGVHEIMVALGSNGGKAWGIYLRAERTDVSAHRQAKADRPVAMPVWVE